MGVEQTTRKILYPPGLRLGPSALLSFPSQSVESVAAINARVRVAIAPEWSSRRNRLPSVFERRRLRLRRRKRHERGFQVVTHDSRKSYGTSTPFRESVLTIVIPHPLRFGKVYQLESSALHFSASGPAASTRGDFSASQQRHSASCFGTHVLLQRGDSCGRRIPFGKGSDVRCFRSLA